MRELTDSELMVASDEDWAIFNGMSQKLPNREGVNGDHLDKFGVEIPYSCGPHILPIFRETIEIVKPKYILEIGFNYGISASFWLELSDATLVTCDISQKDETINAAKVLSAEYGERFIFYFRSELPTTKKIYDLIFIDGGHDEPDVTKDIQLAKDLNIPYILFDDWYFRFGPGVKVSVEKFTELKLVKDFNNLRLYEWQH